MGRVLANPQGRQYLDDHSVFQLTCITYLCVVIKLREAPIVCVSYVGDFFPFCISFRWNKFFETALLDT